MGCLGNLLWLVLGGFVTAMEYFLSGLLMCCTIIGIPFGIQAFKLGILCLWPFGTQVSEVPQDQANGCLNTILNILWICIGGIWIALTHLLFGIICCITIVGIPWGMQHFKMMVLALLPFGKRLD